MHHILLIIHLVSATVWVGGHLILCFRYLPQAIKQKNTAIISDFESKFEPIGIPALILLLITGVFLSFQYGINLSNWFSFSQPIETIVSIKLIILASIVVLAIHARVFIIPSLSIKSLPSLMWHIILVTSLSVLMLVLGTFVRFGGI